MCITTCQVSDDLPYYVTRVQYSIRNARQAVHRVSLAAWSARAAIFAKVLRRSGALPT